MTVDDAIKQLEAIRNTYGGNIKIYVRGEETGAHWEIKEFKPNYRNIMKRIWHVETTKEIIIEAYDR